jgi:hypothetical protein
MLPSWKKKNWKAPSSGRKNSRPAKKHPKPADKIEPIEAQRHTPCLLVAERSETHLLAQASFWGGSER